MVGLMVVCLVDTLVGLLGLPMVEWKAVLMVEMSVALLEIGMPPAIK